MMLKEIIEELKNFFEKHLEINSVTLYDNKGFIGDRGKTYMVANIEYLNTNISGKIRNDSFQITLADLLTPSNTNEADIYSNGLEIAEDFYTFLQYHPDWTFNKAANSQKFTESDGDRIAGLTFTVTLQTIRSQNMCATPNKIIKPPLPGDNKRFTYVFPYNLS